jgi:hypothetical protein
VTWGWNLWSSALTKWIFSRTSAMITPWIPSLCRCRWLWRFLGSIVA